LTRENVLHESRGAPYIVRGERFIKGLSVSELPSGSMVFELSKLVIELFGLRGSLGGDIPIPQAVQELVGSLVEPTHRGSVGIGREKEREKLGEREWGRGEGSRGEGEKGRERLGERDWARETGRERDRVGKKSGPSGLVVIY
jgi:hypothetical protein